ncbi:MAG TPA: WD40 repeat domain-containing protein, partial [Longimicrobium sp.]|nr:WD40 repeat domain-containing protein [Longimicrobium sp.]
VVDEFLLASHAHQQIRRRVVRIGAVTGGFMAVAMVFGLWAMAGKRSAENAMYAERGRIASMFADQPGHEFEALLLGTRAVGPRLEAGRPPPPEAVEGIGDAIATIGDAVFLRDSSGSDVVDFSSDDERILTQSSSRIIVWDALGRQLFSKFADSSGEHRTRDSERVVWRYAKLWPNGRWVVASLGPPRFGDLGPSTRPERYADSIGLHIYNVETGARMPEAEATLGQIDLIGFVPNTPRFYTLRSHPNAAEGDVHLYSGEPGQPIRRVARFAGWSDAVLSPRGSRIATAGADSFAIWDTETGRRIGGARREESVEWMLFSSDDSVLVTTRFPSEGLWMWNAITGQPLGTIIRSNLFSAYPLMTDGKSVVGFNPVEDSVFIWRLPGEGPDRSIHAADYGIRGIYPTGLLLLKAEKQRTRFIVATWNPLLADTPTLYPQLVLFGGNSSARVSDDGTRVALLEPEQSRVRVFRLNQPSHPSRSSSPGRLYAIACDRLAREPTEWQALRKENLCRTETLKKFRG